tara:strand:- start:561 stop:1070 length:510 start_codon:yes stop_codon:yes gene_type:complete
MTYHELKTMCEIYRQRVIRLRYTGTTSNGNPSDKEWVVQMTEHEPIKVAWGRTSRTLVFRTLCSNTQLEFAVSAINAKLAKGYFFSEAVGDPSLYPTFGFIAHGDSVLATKRLTEQLPHTYEPLPQSTITSPEIRQQRIQADVEQMMQSANPLTIKPTPKLLRRIRLRR